MDIQTMPKLKMKSRQIEPDDK